MKKALLLLGILSTYLSFGQSMDIYTFKVENGKPYVPLTGGTNLTAGKVWVKERFKIPLGFTADIGDRTVTDFCFVTDGMIAPASDTDYTVNAFFPCAAYVRDRSMDSIPQSPIRYEISGTSPNKIFKLEFFNVGFNGEIQNNGTNNDSADFQVWLYESSNIVEFRFGPSNLIYMKESIGVRLFGYFKDFDIRARIYNKFYCLAGDPANPVVDSANSVGTAPTVNTYPENGTVYRFIPNYSLTSIGEIDVTPHFKVYPTMVQQELFVESRMAERASAQMMDISGRSVQQPVALQPGSNRLDVGGLPQGQYFVRLSTAEGNAVYRFTKL
ncbi:MAG TPA: T9SS type A sorting domain-containing protein [Chitinophagaceae bacterium]|nr:T9SS type A sorting domain-containing protein [Chitinophagaceae bacterium]